MPRRVPYTGLLVLVFLGMFVFVFVFSLKSSMASFLEYILASIYVFKVVDFKFFGLHRLVWFLFRKRK